MLTVSPTPPETVLVVDDDPELGQLLSQYLVSAGLRPLVAAGGAEMRRHSSRAASDLVLLDVMLPQEDGLDLLRWSLMRRLRARKLIAHIAWNAYLKAPHPKWGATHRKDHQIASQQGGQVVAQCGVRPMPVVVVNEWMQGSLALL
jgi:CheY-like chemotaxis protein